MSNEAEAEAKSKEKISKIKENTKLFNRIIEKHLDDGIIKNVDIEKYKDKEDDLEVCNDVFGNESLDLDRLRINKQKGGKRTSPQALPEIGNSAQNSGKKLLKCPQCDFMTQNETFFNEHMTNVHSGLPNCPFCFLAFKDYSSLRKHCRTVHAETRNNQTERMENIQTGGRARDNIPEGRKNIRPCRYFQNGEGKCAPKNGKCDHSIIPFNEREVCFHNQNCQYKPFCIFYHPEGQREGDWQTNFKKTKICR